MRSRQVTALIRRSTRTGLRLAGLVWVLASAAVGFAGRGEGRGRLHHLCGRLLDLLHVRVHVIGPVPTGGLIVSNHLGYLDILVLGGVMPAMFVAKQEVRSWPVFGWFARRSQTIFVRRERRADSGRAAGEIRAALGTGAPVVLFPEGTSSGGQSVLPFKSALLEPAVGTPVVPAALAYGLAPGEGDPAEAVCYWKDMTLARHLLHLLGKRRIRAVLVFAPPLTAVIERKALAMALHGRVQDLQAVARAHADRGLRGSGADGPGVRAANRTAVPQA